MLLGSFYIFLVFTEIAIVQSYINNGSIKEVSHGQGETCLLCNSIILISAFKSQINDKLLSRYTSIYKDNKFVLQPSTLWSYPNLCSLNLRGTACSDSTGNRQKFIPDLVGMAEKLLK